MKVIHIYKNSFKNVYEAIDTASEWAESDEEEGGIFGHLYITKGQDGLYYMTLETSRSDGMGEILAEG